jgi:hypothetical protein
MFWKPTPGIIIGSDSLRTVSATGVDFVQEFNIADKRFNEFRAVLRGGKTKLRISHVNMVYNEAAVLQRSIVINGRTFNVAANATADLNWELWRLGYERDFVKTGRGLLGFIAEKNFNHVVADLAPRRGVHRASLTDEKVPFPALGVIGRVYRTRTSASPPSGPASRCPASSPTSSPTRTTATRHMKNFDIYVTGSITRYFGVQGGYRALSADYLLDSDTGDLEMKGLYFGAMVRF